MQWALGAGRYRFLGLERPGRVLIGGSTIYHNSYRLLRYLYGEIFIERTYDVGDLGPAPVIVDCGANIGVATWFFQVRYPNSRVISIEPAPHSFELLSRNVKNNGWAVEVHQEASTAVDGVIDLHFKPGQDSTPSASTLRERVTGETITVPAQRLSTRLPEHTDLLKVDIEGAEHDVFRELEAAGALAHVDRVAVEYHHHVREGEDLAGFLDLLDRNGFELSIVASGSRSEPTRYQDIMIYGRRAQK